jgi:hypothetical protein
MKLIVPLRCAMCVQMWYNLVPPAVISQVNGGCDPRTCIFSDAEKRLVGKRLDNGHYGLSWHPKEGEIYVVRCPADSGST